MCDCTREGARECALISIAKTTNYPKSRLKDEMVLREPPLSMDAVGENDLVDRLAKYVKACTGDKKTVNHTEVSNCETVKKVVELMQGKVV